MWEPVELVGSVAGPERCELLTVFLNWDLKKEEARSIVEANNLPATFPKSIVGFVMGKITSLTFELRREKFTVSRMSSVARLRTGTIGEQKLELLSLITACSSSRSISLELVFPNCVESFTV